MPECDPATKGAPIDDNQTEHQPNAYTRNVKHRNRRRSEVCPTSCNPQSVNRETSLRARCGRWYATEWMQTLINGSSGKVSYQRATGCVPAFEEKKFVLDSPGYSRAHAVRVFLHDSCVWAVWRDIKSHDLRVIANKYYYPHSAHKKTESPQGGPVSTRN